MRRVAVLIDNMYLQHVATAYGLQGIDVQRFSLSLLETDEELFMTYVFDALPYLPPNPTPEQMQRKNNKRQYFDRLKYLDRVTVEEGYVKPKQVRCTECRRGFVVPIQKAVDVKMSVRLVSLAWAENVEIIAIVTGDGDFIPAVNAVSNSNAIVRLFYARIGNVGTDSRLIQACPEKREIQRAQLVSCQHIE